MSEDYDGDTYRRTFVDNVARCGCRWEQTAVYGDVLRECPIHRAHGAIRLAAFERYRVCAESNEWPGYVQGPVDWEAQEQDGFGDD